MASHPSTATGAVAEFAAGRRRPHDRALALSALGIVFGDIGTSPIYAIRETFGDTGGLQRSEAAVLGVLSVITLALIVIVTVKYITIVLRADNNGEGGVLAISALAHRSARSAPQSALIVGLAIIGLGLFYGDGLITPAISVLSAIEGIGAARPALEPLVVPLTLLVLLALFAFQHRRVLRVGPLFGPVMLAWFLVLALLGLYQLAQGPGVLRALDPRWALTLFADDPWQAVTALGAVVLVVTGVEALYADMGLFGRRPIRLAWLACVLPALLLNYYGQGALLLRDAAAADHPFFLMAPGWLQWPLVLLTMVATVVASQAVISGVFSLTRQAVQLGYLPRMSIHHTSADEIGRIHIPRVNGILAVGVIGLVLGFGSSGDLAAAYGMSVTGTMGTVTLLAAFVAVTRWRWPLSVAVLVFAPIFLVELAFLAGNALKILHGGWFPLLVAAAIAAIAVTWRRGRRVVAERLAGHGLSLDSFINHLDSRHARVAGTAVFMTARPETVPNALLHNLKHNKVLHERVVFMTVRTVDRPFVAPADRVIVERLGKGFFRVIAHFGFIDEPDVPAALLQARDQGLTIDLALTSFFLGRETLIPSPRPDLGPVQERLFISLSHSSLAATTYFKIPVDRVVELGTQVEL